MFLSEPLLRAILQERARDVERIGRERRLLERPTDWQVPARPLEATMVGQISSPGRARGSACEAA